MEREEDGFQCSLCGLTIDDEGMCMECLLAEAEWKLDFGARRRPALSLINELLKQDLRKEMSNG